jgi:AP-3 complex subunit delta
MTPCYGTQVTRAVVRRYSGLQPGYAQSIAGTFFAVVPASYWLCYSELIEPQKLIPYVLQPAISNLDPDTIAVYIQAATKVFGHWAAELAQRWGDSDLAEVKTIVDTIITRVREFTSSSHIEVQERVQMFLTLSGIILFNVWFFDLQAANTLQLFTLINADLDAYRPKPENSDIGSSFDPMTSAEPRFPKSLYLIEPLFSRYELNPVAASAQASVPIPEGLDLDAWIVPSEASAIAEDVVENEEPHVKKSKKGQEREMNGKSRKGKKKRNEDRNVVPSPPMATEVEAAEEAAETERVRDVLLGKM